LKGDHVFALPYAPCLSTFRAPRWGTLAILPPCRWRNATPWELVPFSRRSASRIFITQPGCGPRLSLSFKDAYHPCWGGERGEPGLYLPHRSAGHLLFQLLVVETIPQLCGGGVLQPCQGRRTVVAQLGCNISPSSSFSWQERGPTGALWSGPLFGFDVWFVPLERGREREPSGRRARPGTIAAAAEVAGESPGTCRPAGSPVWRSFIPAGTEPEFRL
jgi:hypothetical protein